MRRIIRISFAIALTMATYQVFASGENDTWMNGSGAFYGHGRGMGMHGMGGGMGREWGYRSDFSDSSSERLDMQRVIDIVEEELSRHGEPGWEIVEVMEFEYNYYAQIGDSRDGRLVTEVLIDPYSGYVQPEYGPNMMWNLETGHHNRRGLNDRYYDEGLPLTSADAVEIADNWLETRRSDSVADDHADQFPGYYTIHTLTDGKISGMLSVNGWTGRVWYHDWHGTYVAMAGRHD